MRKTILLLSLLSIPCLAQNVRYDGIAQGPRGPVPNATVAFCSQPANVSTTPCSPLLSLCSSLTDVVCSQPNPATADSLGNFHAYVKAANLPFTVQIFGPQVAAPYVLVDQGATSGGGGGGSGLGGVNFQTVNYTPVLSDCGKQITMNGSGLTLTLPNSPLNTTCSVFISNTNATSLTISRNGLTIDGVAANLTLTQFQGVQITTDGSNYFTERGAAAGGLITGSPTNGTQVIGNGSQFVPQAKPFTDVRDLYDCSYVGDSATSLNTAWANGASGVDGSQQTFPVGCHLKLTSTVTVQNHTGFLWRGYSSPGAGGAPALGAPTLSYCGTAGGTVLNMQFANSPTLENLVVDGQGTGCANGAGAGIVFDKIGPGTANTTFGVLRNMQINAGITGAHNTAFIGLNFSPSQSNNVEDFLIDHSFIYCQTAFANINTESTVGIQFNTFNTKEEQINATNVSGCHSGIVTGPGGLRITGGDFGNNGVDIVWTGNADPMVIDDITSEGSAQAFTTPGGGGGNFPNLISNSHFAPSSRAATNSSTVSIGDTNNQTTWTLINNGWDDPSTYTGITGAFPYSSNQNNHVVMVNNNFIGGGNGESLGSSFSVSPTGNSAFILPNGHNFGADYVNIHGGYLRSGGNFTQGGNEDMGFGFYSSLGSDVPGLAYNNSISDGANSGGLSIGRDAMYLADANVVMKGVWPVPTQTIYCGVNGTPGATRYNIRIFAKDAGGNRSGWIDYVGNAGACINAQATFSVGNSVTIVWQPVAGETNGYDVVLMNPASSTTQGWLAGSTAHGTTTLTVTSGPGAFNYVFPNYYDTAKTTLNGRVQIADMGSCTMAAGTCTAQNLKSTYASAPLCFVSWNGSGTLTGILKIPSTTTTVTPASSINTDTAVVNWACYGN